MMVSYRPLAGISPKLQVRCTWDDDEVAKFQVQKVKGYDEMTCGKKSILRPFCHRRTLSSLNWIGWATDGSAVTCKMRSRSRPHQIWSRTVEVYASMAFCQILVLY